MCRLQQKKIPPEGRILLSLIFILKHGQNQQNDNQAAASAAAAVIIVVSLEKCVVDNQSEQGA